MPASFDPRVNDNPSTYMVQDRKNQKELSRLVIQDQMVTTVMGGVLPEQADPTIFQRVLDVGCGPGGWIIEAARTYPTMSLVGIDISQRMIKYARTQAETQQVSDRVEFRVMDALRTLEFANASFDLVNVRFGVSYLRTWDWPEFLLELLRVTHPEGIIRITDIEIGTQSSSPALMRHWETLVCAFYRAGHLFTQESTGLVGHLARLLDQYGCDQVQTKAYAIECQAGTAEGKAYCEDTVLAFQTVRPFIQKWNCACPDHEANYQRALDEMKRPDFFATMNLVTTWGSKPQSTSQWF
jgi:ubiquinone/menaquinone biosynthesis C-methylase UbiE